MLIANVKVNLDVKSQKLASTSATYHSRFQLLPSLGILRNQCGLRAEVTTSCQNKSAIL